jgi:quercetin dioxygenase-like cupin family protein
MPPTIILLASPQPVLLAPSQWPVQKRRRDMNKSMMCSLAFVPLIFSLQAMAQEQGIVRPTLLLQEIVQGMPQGERQEVRVLTATLKPGDKTVFHTHRFPVIIYVLEGAFTLEMEGREPITVKAGETMVEPPNVKMTGYNRSSTDPLRGLMIYVSDPDTPFLDPVR